MSGQQSRGAFGSDSGKQLANWRAKALPITFVALEAADGFLTMWATRNGFSEVNPLLDERVTQTWLFPASKIIIAIIVTLAILPVAKRFSRPVNFAFGAASLFLAVVLVTDLCEMAKAAGWGWH